ncbi:placenta-expressed transcript 1 protein-like isoform X2 [Chiroxiphia lanceolata]|uniref:placenta-expressed transcript 1 protein-like isoform X2 n=1 Tax=Chiroxiphia lanceolata TaxID=296741 RepID=UPI0013CEFC76|nr:placenta-expressed transcript 1 protein-like isoform X2 [Chiroxiphia lanceolata]
MATSLLLAQLLLLGTLVVPAQAQNPSTESKCAQLGNATEGNFSVTVTPEVYQANTTYLVTIKEAQNSTDNEPTQFVLQALSPGNESLGQWEGITPENCSSVDSAVLNSTQNAANWTSPGTNVSSVQIRAYIIFTDKSTQFKTVTLTRAETTTSSPTSTPSSVSTVRGSSLFIAVLQLPLLLAMGKLLS